MLAERTFSPWWSGSRRAARSVRIARESAIDAAACANAAVDTPVSLPERRPGTESHEAKEAWAETNLLGHALELDYRAKLSWVEALVGLLLWVKE